MKRQLLAAVLLIAFVGFATAPVRAQISTTGPAGLARQMPRIYSPYMANRSRIKNQQKHKAKAHRTKTTHTTNHQH